jgi:hypothetical protein
MFGHELSLSQKGGKRVRFPYPAFLSTKINFSGSGKRLAKECVVGQCRARERETSPSRWLTGAFKSIEPSSGTSCLPVLAYFVF